VPTKKQHFVPQFLLRRFATRSGTESRINVYDVERAQYRARQNVRDVCSGNYLYDTDASFEEFLSEHIESPVGEEIDRLAQALEPVNSVANPEFLRFLMVQLARTREAYKNNLAFMNAGVQTMLAELARLNGLDENLPSKLLLKPSEPRAVLAYLTSCAATQWRLISDLKLALVVNDTGMEFVLSDHPVFQHNWYLREYDQLGSASITVRGLQLFLPLSPLVTCCLYDSSVYLYGKASAGKVILASEDDVMTLNSFQAINAGHLLMARSSEMEGQLQALGMKYAKTRSFKEEAFCSPASIREDGSMRSLHVTARRQIQLPAMPSFVKVKKKVKRQPLQCAHRDPDLVLYQEMLDKRFR
jgi:hypothetical protein